MLWQLQSAAEILPGAWRWPHVDPAKEWACHGTGKIVVETDFLDRFERMRHAIGQPLIINSGYRSPEHNRQVSKTGDDGPHTTARAVDIRIYGTWALDLIHLALEEDFTGVGVMQKGPREGRYVHLDDLPNLPDQPRPWIWSY